MAAEIIDTYCAKYHQVIQQLCLSKQKTNFSITDLLGNVWSVKQPYLKIVSSVAKKNQNSDEIDQICDIDETYAQRGMVIETI